MKLLISGHREHKLVSNGYDINWIQICIEEILVEIHFLKPLCYSGMASGVDLYFCNACKELNLPYIACIPFDGQEETMVGLIRSKREELLAGAVEIKKVKNSWMVEHCDTAIVVWDGNKGGTANVVQQLVEGKKNFYWINPVAKVVWKCFI
jgi:uncharacterized phage-like protein YoqJ